MIRARSTRLVGSVRDREISSKRCRCSVSAGSAITRRGATTGSPNPIPHPPLTTSHPRYEVKRNILIFRNLYTRIGVSRQGRYTHMTEFPGRIAVVTGGGSGMGRELVRQLVAEACNVAMCDVSPTGLAETQRLCETAGLPQGLRVTTHIADVADRTQVERFRDEVADRHQTDKIHLLFNNAGISGGGSMITNSRDEWERTFNICWGGVYNCTRAFLPMLQNAEEGHIVNTSSINGFWASVGPRLPHTAYSAAKFAVKGFTEALITDLRINALGRHARPDRDLNPRQHAQDPQRRSRIGRNRCCRSRSRAVAVCFAGPRRLAAIGRPVA